MLIQPNVLYGVNLANPEAIRKKLRDCSSTGDVNTLTGLLKDKTVVKEIDKGTSDIPSWSPLGRAINQTQCEAALVLLRHGANPLCSDGANCPITHIFSAKESFYRGQFKPHESAAIYIAIVANRILQNDTDTVCSLLSSKCALWNLFTAEKLLAETALHVQEAGQDRNALAKALMLVTANEKIPEISKEEFASFCKQKIGVTTLDNDKPEPQKLEDVLQSICSHLLMSPYKNDLLQALELDDSPDHTFIHVLTKKFADNFSEAFKKLFIENPEEVESRIIENYSTLFADLLQIYHHHIPPEYKEQLQNILVNLSEKAAKEPIALSLVFNLTGRINDLQRDNDKLNKTVHDLQRERDHQNTRLAALEDTVRHLLEKTGLNK